MNVLIAAFPFQEVMEVLLEECGRHSGHFGWVDYGVLAVVLVGSCAVGAFYACTGPKQTTSEDFLLGGSSMGTLPTALSLAAGFVSPFLCYQ